MGFSLWWGDEVYLCKVLWLAVASEGKPFYYLNTTWDVKLKVPPATRELLQYYLNVLTD